MPPRKQSRATRARRQAVRQRAVSPPRTEPLDASTELAAPPESQVVAPVATRAQRATARPLANPRGRTTRAPAQIVVGNYDFLRHDLRLLGVLAPSLVIIMIILSFVVH